MSLLLAVDTSVAVPLLVEQHSLHSMMARWAEGKTLHLCGHALLETYSVLTRLPADNRVAAADAARVIDDRFSPGIALSPTTASQAHRLLADRGVAAGATWDGLVALAAIEHDAILVTRDVRALATYDALNVRVELLSSAKG